MEDADKNDSIRVIILTGSKKAFAAGADIKEMMAKGFVDMFHNNFFSNHLDRIQSTRKPIIAAVAGYALGGGCELAMMCDFIIAADNAKFGQTGPKVGSFDGGWGASYMARIIGQKRAREVWFLCRMYDAKTALDWGLVNAVVSYENLESETIQWCREMLEKSRLALR